MSRLESPSAFSSRIVRRSSGSRSWSRPKTSRACGHLARRVGRGGDVPGPVAVDPERLLAVHVLLPAGGAAVLVDHLVLRSPGQEGDKVPRILELRRPAPDPPEEAPPDALEEVERVEPRPQEPGQLPADDQADLRLVPPQQLPGGVLVARLDPAPGSPRSRRPSARRRTSWPPSCARRARPTPLASAGPRKSNPSPLALASVAHARPGHLLLRSSGPCGDTRPSGTGIWGVPVKFVGCLGRCR